MKAQDVFAKVTDEIIHAIEAGAGSWEMPWYRITANGLPESVDGHRYRGMNTMWLLMVAAGNDWHTGKWATYQSWQRHGCQVRRGEKGTPVIFWKQTRGTDDDRGPARDADSTDGEAGEKKPRPRWYARSYTVFAAEQVDGADEYLTEKARGQADTEPPERIAAAEAYFAALGATVTEAGSQAFYQPATDAITVPPLALFKDAEHFYSTLAHEHVHWTAHPDRCNRDLAPRFRQDAYAAEELVAELGAAMWCAQTGIAPATRDDHAAYLAGWLRILKADPRHLATVATQAQAALDWMNRHSGTTTQDQAAQDGTEVPAAAA